MAPQGGDFDAFLAAFRFGLLGPLKITGSRSGGPSALPGGRPRGAQRERHGGDRPSSPTACGSSHGGRGEGKEQVRASGPFRFTAGDPGEALALPDLTGRTAVATFAEIGSSGPLGQPAPDVTLRTLDGGTVRLAGLRGSVVVIDFWATWCVPCWEALEHTEELAAWAKSSGLPVKVFALNTMESTRTKSCAAE